MTIRSRYQEALDEVTSLRDTARLHAHLFSLDARDRWKEVERALDSARSEAKKEGEEAADLALDTLRKAAELGRHLLQHRQEESRELREPATHLMTTLPHVCGSQDSLNRAAQLMWDGNCGIVPVVGEHRILIGVITDRDIAMAAYTKGGPLENIRVDQAMSHSVVVASEQSTVGEVLGIMSTHQLRRIPVVDGRGHLLGIIALADIARYVASKNDIATAQSLVRTLAAISSPEA